MSNTVSISVSSESNNIAPQTKQLTLLVEGEEKEMNKFQQLSNKIKPYQSLINCITFLIVLVGFFGMLYVIPTNINNRVGNVEDEIQNTNKNITKLETSIKDYKKEIHTDYNKLDDKMDKLLYYLVEHPKEQTK